MTGERKTELDKDALEKACQAYEASPCMDLMGPMEAAILAYLTGGIPEGWKLVPVEPTEAMLHAGWLQTGESYEMADRTYDRLKRHYEVMLAAAPPLTPGEQK